MMEPGTYKARAIEGALGLTSTESEQVAVRFAITQGPHQGDEITWYGFFTEKTIDRTLESLRYMGWAGDDLSELNGIDKNEVSLVIEHEERDFNGEMKTVARVRWVNSGGGGLKNKLEGAPLKAFAARMKGHVVAQRQKMGLPNATAPRARATGNDAPPPSDDDAPPY